MDPRHARVAVTITRKIPAGMACDGNTTLYRTECDTKLVHALVWPVAMSADEMLVEFDDGRLGKAKMANIKML